MKTGVLCTIALSLCALSVSAQGVNLLTNPGFDTNLDGWTSGNSPENATFGWQAEDATGGTGSALITNTTPSGSNGIGLEQCIPVTAGRSYSWSGMLRIPPGQAAVGWTSVNVHWMGDLQCAGSIGYGPIATSSLDDPLITWSFREKIGEIAPIGAVAARVYVLNGKYDDPDDFVTMADDVSFSAYTIFSDGFEDGSTNAWTATVGG
jgi:hypothetical protein